MFLFWRAGSEEVNCWALETRWRTVPESCKLYTAFNRLFTQQFIRLYPPPAWAAAFLPAFERRPVGLGGIPALAMVCTGWGFVHWSPSRTPMIVSLWSLDVGGQGATTESCWSRLGESSQITAIKPFNLLSTRVRKERLFHTFFPYIYILVPSVKRVNCVNQTHFNGYNGSVLRSMRRQHGFSFKVVRWEALLSCSGFICFLFKHFFLPFYWWTVLGADIVWEIICVNDSSKWECWCEIEHYSIWQCCNVVINKLIHFSMLKSEKKWWDQNK